MPPGITFEGLRFRAYRGAALVVSGEARRATFRRDSTAVAAELIAARLPGRAGEADTLVTAPAAQGSLRGRELEASGGVAAKRGPVVARTERVRWDGGEGLLVGEEPVALRGPGYALDGPGFVLDPGEATVRITGKGMLRAGRGVGR